MEIIMYTTHCPQCEVLAKKLAQKRVSYSAIEDVEIMSSMGLTAVPALSIDGQIMDFKNSINWLNSLEV